MKIETQLTNNHQHKENTVREIKLPAVCWDVIRKATEESQVVPKVKYTIDVYA